MRIIRAVKSAGVDDQLKRTLRVAQLMGIKALEIHSITEQVRARSAAERAEPVIRACQQYGIEKLVYHSCPFPINVSVNEAYAFDLASRQGMEMVELARKVMEEASLVGNALSLKDMPIVVHAIGIIDPAKANAIERSLALARGEANLLALKEIADQFSRRGKCTISIARENNTVMWEGPGTVLLDLDPRDTCRTAYKGIRSCLDFSHFQQVLIYQASGRADQAGADIALAGQSPWNAREILESVAPNISVLHLNDSDDFTPEHEGLEIGRGTSDFLELIPAVCKNLSADAIGTYEIKGVHDDPPMMMRSEEHLRSIFGRDFGRYFI